MESFRTNLNYLTIVWKYFCHQIYEHLHFAATTLLSAHPKCDAGASLQDVLMGLLHSGVIRPLSGVIGQNTVATHEYTWCWCI